MTSYDTIVVGLGASGAVCVSRLARSGRRVLGLEAAERVGGRVHTVPCGGGELVELGAEWIHGTENSPVYDLATTNNIPIQPQDLVFRIYRSDGSEGPVELVNELIAYCLGVLEESPPAQPEPLGQFVQRECTAYISRTHPNLLEDGDFVSEFFAFMNLFTNNYEATEDWNDVTTASRYTELEGHQHMSWHKIGYRTLFDILLNTHNNGPGLSNARIELNKEVTEILWSTVPSDDVIVKCTDGTQYRARNVIVTVSLGVLKERHATLFSPPLPANKVEAIEAISMGVMDKIVLVFDKQWWPQDRNFFGFIWKSDDKKKVAIEDYWMTRIFGASRPMGCDRVLTLWTSGETAKLVERLPEDVVRRKATQLLRMFMGSDATIPEPTAILRSTWYSNRFTRGSYTYDNLLRVSRPEARAHLAAPLLDSTDQPRVLFAGEATNQTHFSTVHGALETGIREVNRLLGNLRSKI